MERCPNCGAPARPGAKFCTTCGSRLPEAAAPVLAEASGEQETIAGWAPPVEAELPPTASSEAAEAGESSETSPTAADQVLSTSWPTDGPPSWPTSWGDQSPEPSEPGEVPVPAEPVAAETPAADRGWEEMTAIFLPELAVEQPPIIGIKATGAADAQVRALALLDELRGLLPVAMAAPAAGRTTAVADALEKAIAPGNAEDDAQQADLRAALVAARDRPRDIDTVLDLSRRVDAIIVLLDAYDRCVEAITQAVTTLRASGTEEP